jgi:hypothetical protein
MNHKSFYPTATLGAAALIGSVVVAIPAQAGGGDFTERAGRCSAAAHWVMKAKPDTGRIELEFSVETQRAGQRWRVRITDNGKQIFLGRRITNRVSHSFSVDRMVGNRSGTDRFRARAENGAGQVCFGHVPLAPNSSNSG